MPSDTHNTEPLGTVLRSLRKQSGLSLAELAARAGCTKGYLSSIETARRPPPGEALLDALERSLGCAPGLLRRLADRERSPDSVRAELEHARTDAAVLARLRALCAAQGLDAAHRAGLIQGLIDSTDTQRRDGDTPEPVALQGGCTDMLEVPLINKVAAGYPAEFTDLGYPARVADDYVRCPGISDPDAFAARVVGDSMDPDYREGDIVVFSPMRDIASGDDCFARLSCGDESTFKRVYFEQDGARELIRLQPVNSAYAPRVLDREDVAGLYRAVHVMRAL